MFSYYKIGVNVPAAVYIPQKVRDAHEAFTNAHAFAIASPKIINQTVGIVDFISGQKQENTLEYHSIGIDTKKLPLQISSKIVNPQIEISPLSLQAKNNFTDYWIVAMQHASRTYGNYPNINMRGRIVVPITTPAMVFDTQAFLLEHIKKSRRGAADVTASRERALTLQDVGKRTKTFFNESMRQAGIKIDPDNLEYVQFLKTTIIPAQLAKKFWENFHSWSVHLGAVKGLTAFTQFRLLGEAFWERAQEVAKKVAKSGKELGGGLKRLLEKIGTILIVMAVLVGGFLTWQIIGAIKA